MFNCGLIVLRWPQFYASFFSKPSNGSPLRPSSLMYQHCKQIQTQKESKNVNKYTTVFWQHTQIQETMQWHRITLYSARMIHKIQTKTNTNTKEKQKMHKYTLQCSVVIAPTNTRNITVPLGDFVFCTHYSYHGDINNDDNNVLTVITIMRRR